VDSKYAVYAFLISDTDLDMSFVVESRVRVDAFAFRKHAANGIKWLLLSLLSREVKEVDDGAVEIPLEQVIAPDILRHHCARSGDYRSEGRMRLLDRKDSVRADEIETEPWIDYGPDNEGLDHATLIFQEPCSPLLRPVKRSIRIRLPEIDSGTQPVVCVLTWVEGFVGNYTLACVTVTAVVSEEE
jgi:hypothetical protein